MNRTTARMIVGLLAVVYGLGVAFGELLLGSAWPSWWLMGGAFVVGIAWLVLMVIPWARRRLSGEPTTDRHVTERPPAH